RAFPVESVIKPNRLIEVNSMWAKCKPLTVKLHRPGGMMGSGDEAWSVDLKAVHDGRALSLLAVWADGSAPGERVTYTVDPKFRKRKPGEPEDDLAQERVSWVWDNHSRQYFRAETPADLFAVKFCLSGSSKACMMNGDEGTYDVWEWRDGWSHITGYADDRKLIVTRKQPASGPYNAYPIPVMLSSSSPDAEDMIYVQWEEDAGDLPYEFTPRPLRFERPIMPGIRARTPSGSAGDVLAEAIHQQGTWALELWRLLKTGHDDDYQLEGKGPHAFSIAVTDGQEGQAHFTSDLIYLYLD
ncbi:hypothetical protein HYR69_05595, partial [Candidatus Sumerlaeota bacterium]|nr:hypothetical protein [Candidatus Sumerlaeota bacterium]